MEDTLFRIIAVAATIGFVAGLLAGFWPLIVGSVLMGILFAWLAGRFPRPR